MGSTITNNGENLVCEMKGEKEIPASVARSLWCHGMLMNVIYVVSRENHMWEVWVMGESI